MKLTKKQVSVIDLTILAGTALALAFLVNYATPLIISPNDNLETTNNQILFSIEKGNYLLIDDNPEFSSPEKVFIQDNLTLNLKPGEYYWKVGGILNSRIRKLNVTSKIDIRLQSNNETYNVINAGNVLTNVSFYADENFMTSKIIDLRDSTPVTGNLVKGEQYE